MGRERHRDGLVDIEPFRMVVELLGDERRPRHEPECFVEVAKHEGPGNGIAVFDLAPAGKLGERRLAGISGQFLGHRSHSSLVCTIILPRLKVAEPLAKPRLSDYLT